MSRKELETEWSINDVWDANIVLDLIEISEEKAAHAAKVEAENERRR